MPGSRPLLLVPTALEREVLLRLGGFPALTLELCGFGPIAAAARAAGLLSELRPARVLLLGIAGSFDLGRAPLESAHFFARIRLEGVWAGQGAEQRSAGALGFPHWRDERGPIGDELELGAGAAELLTVCAAAASRAEAEERRARHPAALAEDMEGFGVALACRLAGVELHVVRGISNRAGERDRQTWRVEGALRAARALALEHLARLTRGLPA